MKALTEVLKTGPQRRGRAAAGSTPAGAGHRLRINGRMGQPTLGRLVQSKVSPPRRLREQNRAENTISVERCSWVSGVGRARRPRTDGAERAVGADE